MPQEEQPKHENQQPDEEKQKEKEKKIKFYQLGKRRRAIKKLKELDKKRKKLEKQIDKYSSKTFLLLTLCALVVDLFDYFIAVIMGIVSVATVIPIVGVAAIPVGAALSLVFAIIALPFKGVIWLKIHKDTVNQKTGESFIYTLMAIVIEIFPIISVIPATTARVLKAWNAAYIAAGKRRDELKETREKEKRLERRLRLESLPH